MGVYKLVTGSVHGVFVRSQDSLQEVDRFNLCLTRVFQSVRIEHVLFLCAVTSSRYDGQSSGAIEVISPASSPAQREEKNERSFSSEKSTQPATGENVFIVDLDLYTTAWPRVYAPNVRPNFR